MVNGGSEKSSSSSRTTILGEVADVLYAGEILKSGNNDKPVLDGSPSYSQVVAANIHHRFC